MKKGGLTNNNKNMDNNNRIIYLYNKSSRLIKPKIRKKINK